MSELIKQEIKINDDKFKTISYSYGVYNLKRVSEKITIEFTSGRVIEYSAIIPFPPNEGFNMQQLFNDIKENIHKNWFEKIKFLPKKIIKK